MAIDAPFDARRRGVGLQYAALTLLVAVAALFGLLLRARSSTSLSPIQGVGGTPLAPVYRDGTWFWLDRLSADQMRLVRVRSGGIEPVATAAEISAFDAAGGKVAWAERSGQQWSMLVSEADGSGKRTVFTGPERPASVSVADGAIFWTASVPPAYAGNVALPALAGQTRILSIPLAGGRPADVGRLLESEAALVGVHGSTLFVAALRGGSPGCLVLYAVPARGGAATRIASDPGRYSAILTHNGTPYWLALSQESSDSFVTDCVRKFSGGKVQTVCDWLPSGGDLYDTDRGIRYISGGVGGLWAVPREPDLPELLRVPPAYFNVIAGGSDLIMRGGGNGPAVRLFRTHLP